MTATTTCASQPYDGEWPIERQNVVSGELRLPRNPQLVPKRIKLAFNSLATAFFLAFLWGFAKPLLDARSKPDPQDLQVEAPAGRF